MDCKYENLKRDVRTLEEYKRNSEGRLMDLNNQITEASNYVEYYKAGLLKLAFLCLTQSMRDYPEKYYCLIHYGGSSTRGYSHPSYGVI